MNMMTCIQQLNRAADLIEQTAAQMEQVEDEITSVSLDEMLKTYKSIKDSYTALDDARKKIYHIKDGLEKFTVPKRLEEMGVDEGVKVVIDDETGYTFYVQTKYSARTIDKEELFKWLRSSGGEDLITETVNSGTLASFLKEMALEQGIDPPSNVVELTTYNAIGMAKFKPKRT